ncbi:MAG: DMT family transporter [Patescibacteria group bacterium]
MISIKDKNIKGYIFAVISSFFVTANFVLTKIVVKEVNPETASLYFVGFGLLASFLFLTIKKQNRELIRLFKQYWKPMVTFGTLGGAGILMWFYAIDLIGPTTSSFLIRSVVVFTIIWGILFLKERFNKIEVLGMLIAIIGVFVITFTVNSDDFLLSGVIIALAAAFFFSIMQLIVKLYVARMSPLIVNHCRLTFTFLALLVYSLSFQKIQPCSSSILILSALGGILGGVIGVVFFFKALELADLSKANIIRTMDPFVVIAYSFFVFQEVPTLNKLFGGLIIVTGVVLLTLSRRRPKIISRWIP